MVNKEMDGVKSYEESITKGNLIPGA